MWSRTQIVVFILVVLASFGVPASATASAEGLGRYVHKARAGVFSLTAAARTQHEFLLSDSKGLVFAVVLFPYALWLLLYLFLRHDAQRLKSLLPWLIWLAWIFFGVSGTFLVFTNQHRLFAVALALYGTFRLLAEWVRRKSGQEEPTPSSDGWWPTEK